MMLDGPLPTMPEGNSVLVVMAHPDDAEFGCGGTIAKWAAAGKEINYVLCTSGDKGSSDPDISPYRLAQTRRGEQINAAHALGARDVVFLSHEDGTLRNTIELRRDIVREIRRFRPDAVICQDPTMRFGGNRYLNHPDHRAAGDACLDAVYPSARDPHVFPELLIEELLKSGSTSPNASSASSKACASTSVRSATASTRSSSAFANAHGKWPR